MSTLDHTLKSPAVHRVEVITGTGRRRRFSEGDKALVIEETLAPGAVVSEIARRHGLSPQQLFGWRRQARKPVSANTETAEPLFVPALVEAALPKRVERGRTRNRPLDADCIAGLIEMEIGDVTVRVGRDADAKTVAVVIRALKDIA